jgi:large subunit ribosomal protein L22
MHLRASPRKLKLVVDLVRGKKLYEGLKQLEFMAQAAARPITKLLRSAEANAKNNHKFSDGELWISRFEVGQGPVLKRWRPAARGSAHPIRRPMAHLKLVLSDIKPKTKGKK